MKTYPKFLFLFMVAAIITGCKKQIENTAGIPVAQSGYQRSVSALTKEVARALVEVYADHNALMEVNAAIASGYYADERVLLKDLLNPSQSLLYRSDLFKNLKTDTGIFRRKFCEIIEKGNYPLVAAELRPVLKPFQSSVAKAQLLPDGTASILSPAFPVSIYFPYSENFGNAQIFNSLPSNSKLAIVLKPTIVYTDRDADNAPGKKPYYCPNTQSKLCYADVMVNDKYAEISPTHIVTIGAVRFKTAVVTRDEIITQRKIDRKSLLRDGLNNQGDGDS